MPDGKGIDYRAWGAGISPEYLKTALTGINRTLYEDMLEIFLKDLKDSGIITNKQAGDMFDQAQQAIDREGIHADLPFFWETMGPRVYQNLKPAMAQWQRKYGGWEEAERQRQEMAGARGQWQAKQWVASEEERLLRAREAGTEQAWQARQQIPSRMAEAGMPQFAGAESWIDQWFAADAAKYGGQRITPLIAMRAKEAAGVPATLIQARGTPGYVPGIGEFAQARAEEAREAGYVFRTPEGGLVSPGGIPVGYGETEYRPKAPPFPKELKPFVPQAKVGQEMEKWAPLVLSGQQAQRVSPSEWAKFRGYLGWATPEVSWEDYQKRLMEMLPTAQPRKPKWRVARQ